MKYDELNEKYISLNMQKNIFDIYTDEIIEKAETLTLPFQNMNTMIDKLKKVKSNGVEKDKKLGWKPKESN